MDSVLRGLAVYLVLLVIIRLSGRRSIGQMTPFDFVLLLIVAETTQQALLGDDFSITNSVILILTLVATDIVFSLIKQRSPAAAVLLDGSPTVLISRGRPDPEALRRARVSLADVMVAARDKHGLRRLEDVDFAILEANGDLSIVPAEKERG